MLRSDLSQFSCNDHYKVTGKVAEWPHHISPMSNSEDLPFHLPNEASTPKLTYCDPDGDRRISAGSPGCEREFVVSSKAMGLACKPWKAMLGEKGAFLEATGSHHAQKEPPIHFYDDDVNTLSILLNAAHLRYAHIPASLRLNELFNLAVLCDKYDAARLVQPWVDHWIQHREYSSRDLDNVEKWLFISWTFGREKLFSKLSTLLLQSLYPNDDGWWELDSEREVDEDVMPPQLYRKSLFTIAGSKGSGTLIGLCARKDHRSSRSGFGRCLASILHRLRPLSSQGG